MKNAPLILLLAVGCARDDVNVKGTVYTGADLEAEALAEATVEIHDEQGLLFDQGQTDADGEFSLFAPRGQTIYAVVAKEGFATTSFTGQSGLETGEPLRVDEGDDAASGHTLYTLPIGDLEGWRTQLEGCPALSGGGRAMAGEVRVFDLADEQTGEHPIVTTAQVKVVSTSGVERNGCYLTDDGSAWDPESNTTGQTGFYVVFGLDPGLQSAEISYTAFDTEQVVTYQSLYVPDDEDALVPRFPTWVEFPF